MGLVTVFRHALAPIGVYPATLTFSNATAITLQSTTNMVAHKFFPPTSTTYTHVDFWLNRTGAPVGVQLTAEIQTDNGDSPSGSSAPAGVVTGAITQPASAGAFVGETAFGTPYSLTAGTPYWLVIKAPTATTLDSTANWGLKHGGTGHDLNRGKQRRYNGADWTTVTATLGSGVFVLKTTSSNHVGLPLNSQINAVSGSSEVYSDAGVDNRQAVSFVMGAGMTIQGVGCQLRKKGTPKDLIIDLYQGSTRLTSSPTLNSSDVVSQDYLFTHFSTAATVTPGSTCYVVFRAASTGGTSGNSMDLLNYGIVSSYTEAILPPNWRFLYGTGADPSAYTSISSVCPVLGLFVTDPATDFTSTAAPITNVTAGVGGMIE